MFSSIVKKLGIDRLPEDESSLTNADDPILRAIANYKNQPIISRIKNYMKEKE